MRFIVDANAVELMALEAMLFLDVASEYRKTLPFLQATGS
jgi:hypothetical protein